MKRLTSFLALAALVGWAPGAGAQEVRMVEVEGRLVRVQTAGLEDAARAAPVVVFEAGFMMNDGLSAWTSVVGEVAEFVPVVAYDRAGIGGSEPDGEVPTPRHVAENLHGLLDALNASPPYVLVGHSLGGIFIRMYAAHYPEEVAGLVYVDPAIIMSERDSREYDRAMGISEEGRRKLTAAVREGFSDLPNGSVRAEAEMMYDQGAAGWPEFQQLPPEPDVPVSVLMAARYEPRPADDAERDCAPKECHSRRIAYRGALLAEMADEMTNGTLTVANNTGHFIQNDDPELVVWSIRRVLAAEPPRAVVSVPRSLLEEYVGVYEVRPEAGFTVTLEYDQLFAQFTGQRALPIFAESDSVFFFRAVDYRLSFHRNAAGEVTRLVWRQNGPDIPFERVR